MTTLFDILSSETKTLLSRYNLTTTRVIEDEEGNSHEDYNAKPYDHQIDEAVKAFIEKLSEYVDDRPATQTEINNQFIN